MSDNDKRNDLLPPQFNSYEEAAEFWDTHDTTAYLDDSVVVAANSELRQRRYEIELEPAVAQALAHQAKVNGVEIGSLANDLLRRQLAAS